MKTLNITIILLLIFLNINLASAFDFDNVKSFQKDSTTSEYGKITITNAFGLGSKIEEVELKENTKSCSDNCYAKKTITIYEDGPLINGIRFYDISKTGKKALIDFNDYQLYIKQGEEEEIVNDYGLVCRNYVNGSEYCSYEKTGQHKELKDILTEYQLGESKPAGTYEVVLRGNKQPSEVIDWQIFIQNKWLDEWAVWGESEVPFYNGGDMTTAVVNSMGGQVGTAYKFTANKTTSIAIASAYLLVGSAVSNMNRSVGIFTDNAGVPGTLVGGWSENKIMASQNGYVNWTWSSNAPSITSGTPYWVVFNLTSGGSPTGYFRFGETTGGTEIYFTTADWSSWSTFGGSVSALNVKLYDPFGSLTLNSPINNYNSTTSSVNFNATASIVGGTTITNMSLWTNSTGIWKRNQTVHRNGTTNQTQLNLILPDKSSTLWGFEACDSDGDCGFSSNRTVNIDTSIITENSQTYNTSTVFETSYETFLMNFSYNSSIYPTVAGTLIHNNTRYTGTFNGGNGEGRVSKSIDIPLVTNLTNVSFYWEVLFSNSTGSKYFNSSFKNQTISPITFGLCNASNNNAYINYTFKDESTLNYIQGQIQSSNFIYYLGSGGLTKSITFSNSTSNPSYSFCFTPQNRSMHLNPSIVYLNTSYPSRTYSPGVIDLTNLTTNKTLYLLSATDGIYVTFVTTTSLSTLITGATISITREISGENVTIGSGITDAAGSYTIWLNPNYPHTVTASKAGYGSTTQTITPTQSSYTLVLSGGGGYNYTSNTAGLLWGIFPAIGMTRIGSQYFGFNVSSLYDNLEKCKIELLNANKTTILANSETVTTNSSYCTAQVLYNPWTNNQTTIKGRLLVDLGSGYVIIEEDAYWAVLNYTTTNMTLIDWFRDLKSFNLSYFSGENDGVKEQHREFTNILVFFLIATILCAVLNIAGLEWDTETQGGIIFFMGLLVWMASIAGFLELSGISPISVVNKYFVAIIYTLFMIGFATRNF